MGTKKRLAILGTRGIPARYGGFETFAEEIAVRLVKRGVDVTVYCGSCDGKEPLETYHGVNLVHLRSRNLGSLSTIVFDLKCLWHARNKFDVVYMLGYGSSIFCFIPRLWGEQVWINMDGVEWARSKWSRIGKMWLRAMEISAMYTPNRIIADACAIRAFLESRFHHIPKCSVIPYGAHVTQNSKRKPSLSKWDLEEYGYYLMVCRLEPENHVAEIIDGYMSSDVNYPLVVVGDCSDANTYAKQLLAAGGTRVRFLGAVYDKDDLRDIRAYCRCYFHGHSVGGTNPSLLEAMGCGNAVIAHDNAFNREVAGKAALYFKHSHEIPTLLHQLEDDNNLYSQMRVTAVETIVRKYRWEGVVLRYLELLQEV